MRKNYVVCLCVLLLCGVTSSAFAAKKNSRKEIRDSLKKTEVDIRYLREKCNHWSIAAHVGVDFRWRPIPEYNHIFPRTFAECSFGVDNTFNPIFGLYLEYMRNPYAEKGRMNITQLMEATLFAENADRVQRFVAYCKRRFICQYVELFYRYRKQVVGLYVNTGLGMAFMKQQLMNPNY